MSVGSLVNRFGKRWVLVILAMGLVATGGVRAVMQSADTGSREVNEATNFSVAVSPDGRTIVTDFQGSLWTMSGTGGPAKRITDLTLRATEPTFSPKGDRILFQGYLDDGWDLWSVALDGSDARRITWGPFDDTDPQYSHDGRHIAFSSERGGNLDIWILDPASGAMRQLTTNAANESLPAWSPDDREIAYISNRTPNPGVYAANIVDGSERLIAAVPQGRIGAPNWTPDGKQVIYSVIAGDGARLELSGKPIVTGEDVFPFRVAWTGANEFVYSSDGKIKKRTLAGPSAQNIEFTASLPVAKAAPGKLRRWDFDQTKARKAIGIVHPAISPNGQKVVFSALGDIWTMDVGGKPTRLTSDKFALNADPAWSPDGSQLVYTSDRAGNGNLDLWVRDLASGKERRLTELPTADGQSAWSPDGKRIAFLSILSHAAGAELYVIDAAGGKPRMIQRFGGFSPSAPTWSPDGRTLMVASTFSYSRGRAAIYKIQTFAAEGGQGRTIEYTPNSSVVLPVDEGPIWSPDGTKVAFVHQGLLYAVDVDRNGNPTGALHQMSKELAHAPSWTGDSAKILYLATDQLKLVAVADGAVKDVPLDLTWRESAGKGRTVVHASRLWNGRDAANQTDKDIVIEGGRIKSIEPHKQALHTGNVIDATNKSVIPGLIDMHMHIYQQYGEAAGRQYLAYGVTTMRDVGMEAYRLLEYREMWESGERIGPRLYMAGPAWDGTRTSYTEFYTIEPGARADMEFERSKRLGFDWFKMYLRLPPIMQKRIIDFAHQNGMGVTSHEIYPVSAWGVDAVEHLDENPFKASALGNTYADAIQLMAGGGMVQCPTLNMVSYPAIAAEDPTLLTEERIKVLVPDWALTGVRNRMERYKNTGPKPVADYIAQKGRLDAALMKAGVKIVAGTDSPNLPHGQALQTEIVTMVRGGMTPLQALQTATINAAEALGAAADYGTLEPGKIADLVVVDGDPLADIKAARNVAVVMKYGQAWDMKTLLNGGGVPANRSTSTGQ